MVDLLLMCKLFFEISLYWLSRYLKKNLLFSFFQKFCFLEQTVDISELQNYIYFFDFPAKQVLYWSILKLVKFFLTTCQSYKICEIERILPWTFFLGILLSKIFQNKVNHSFFLVSSSSYFFRKNENVLQKISNPVKLGSLFEFGLSVNEHS